MSCKFRKARGNVDAMAFSGRRKGAATFLPLGKFTAPPATFLIPLQTPGVPEEWDLQGQALIKDQPIGLPSDLVQLIVRA